MDTELRQAIFLTLKYFDLFDYPLKSEEVFKWLFCAIGEKYGWEDTQKVINILIEEQKIVVVDGFYFLPGREKTVNSRRAREQISLSKIKKARRMARLLALVPAVKMLAICSNLGYLNADEGADIDFFIVAKQGRIWGARFWSVAIMKFLGQRPNKKTIKNKICLSYFVSENNLDLKNTAIGQPDVHLIYLLSQYLPIYSEDNLWSRFVTANDWIKNYLPNFCYQKETEKFMINKAPERSLEPTAKIELGGWENFYKKIQLRIMPRALKEVMRKNDKKVIINDQMLKLHSNDKREEINRRLIGE